MLNGEVDVVTQDKEEAEMLGACFAYFLMIRYAISFPTFLS